MITIPPSRMADVRNKRTFHTTPTLTRRPSWGRREFNIASGTIIGEPIDILCIDWRMTTGYEKPDEWCPGIRLEIFSDEDGYKALRDVADRLHKYQADWLGANCQRAVSRMQHLLLQLCTPASLFQLAQDAHRAGFCEGIRDNQNDMRAALGLEQLPPAKEADKDGA